MKHIALLTIAFLFGEAVSAQELSEISLPLPADSTLLDVRTSDMPRWKELYMTPIAGAPCLEQPVQVDGTRREIRLEEHGLSYPTLYDWNGDGLQDLLVGEFLTGQSRIKVYLNTGSRKKPRFTGEWFYATDTQGGFISNYQWCCIGIHPQVVDVDGDGIPDLFSGQYYPGVVSWWKGTLEGFLPRQEIPQEGYQTGKEFNASYMGDEPMWSMESWEYWNYTSARLADYDGDGLPDLFVGGNGGYRVARNTGTRENPRFGRREFLFHVDGEILHTRRAPGIRIATGEPFDAVQACSGTTHCYLNPVDWDGDGVLDIIATDEYTHEGEWGVYFLRGVRTDDGLRFLPAQPLFLARDGSKALPGCAPHVQVVDWNSDGIPDLLMGLSIPTINGFCGAEELYYRWIGDLMLPSPGKDTGEALQYYASMDELRNRIITEPYMKQMLIGKLDDWKYLTLRHRGYVYLFQGHRNPVEAVPVPMKAAAREFEYDKPARKKETPRIAPRKPVSCFANLIKSDSLSYRLHVSIKTTGTFHLYTPAAQNLNEPVRIEIELPEGFTLEGEMRTPPTTLCGSSEIYDGKLLVFEQKIRVPNLKGKYTVRVKTSWQACNESSCLPPEEKTDEFNIAIGN